MFRKIEKWLSALNEWYLIVLVGWCILIYLCCKISGNNPIMEFRVRIHSQITIDEE